ncbi:hypothetical protein [Streptomyces sp. H27-S2]|uniref:hypothetical protein n=1 Tax=Streptomyces antarcticus TaxID=2996458 RepID=UPI00226F55CF|nr:hypothetical protein [Streptomyces sp. H27-S2]MCY0954721.1 hypothetical protein [Streptomyces sp. H27-S2]
MRISGREPVYLLAVIAVIAVTLKLAAAYGWEVTEFQQTLVNTFLACAVAVASAIVLKTGAAGAAILQLAQAALALFVGFGLDLSATEQAGWMSLVSAVLAFVSHDQVEAPVARLPIETSSPVKATAPQVV